jgi:hypothetical protein
VLPPRQKGCQSAPFWILHPSAYSSRINTESLQSYGAKTEIWTPMHTWPTRHPQLACTAHIAFISLVFHRLSHAGTILKVWSETLLHWLDLPRGLHPSVCAPDFWTCPQTPFYPICSKRVAIDWAWSEDSKDVFKVPWKWSRKENPLKKTERGPPLPLSSPIRPIEFGLVGPNIGLISFLTWFNKDWVNSYTWLLGVVQWTG